MPLVRIDLPEGTSPSYRSALVDVVYEALTTVAGAPENDRFMVASEHRTENLVMDRHYLVDRTAQALIIQITFNRGRDTDVKKKLYQAIAQGLHDELGLRIEDVFINLVEVPKENWSFGSGVAQYAT